MKPNSVLVIVWWLWLVPALMVLFLLAGMALVTLSEWGRA